MTTTERVLTNKNCNSNDTMTRRESVVQWMSETYGTSLDVLPVDLQEGGTVGTGVLVK